MSVLQFFDEPKLMGDAFKPGTRQTMKAALAGALGLPSGESITDTAEACARGAIMLQSQGCGNAARSFRTHRTGQSERMSRLLPCQSCWSPEPVGPTRNRS